MQVVAELGSAVLSAIVQQMQAGGACVAARVDSHHSRANNELCSLVNKAAAAGRQAKLLHEITEDVEDVAPPTHGPIFAEKGIPDRGNPRSEDSSRPILAVSSRDLTFS